MKKIFAIAVYFLMFIDAYILYVALFKSANDQEFTVNILVWLVILLIALIFFMGYLYEIEHEKAEKRRTQVWEMNSYIEYFENR